MTLTEIVAKLKAFANSMKLAPVGDAMGFDESDAVWLDAAITHLDPHTQPITPEGLEAAGFERCTGGMRRHVTKDASIAVGLDGGADVWTSGIVTRFPGVRSMGHVLGLIEMLEGGDGA